MKKSLIIIILSIWLFSNFAFGQIIESGEYSDGLKLAYDTTSKKITGYYESYTGWDEETKTPRFSCIFYIEGNGDGKKIKITTYYPEDKTDDIIEGSLEVTNSKAITIKLSDEHGGCWNVQHFIDKPVNFELEKSFKWIQIRYVDTSKSHFYNEKSNEKKQKAYLIKGNIVCVEKIEGEWAFCSYFGKKVSKGWLKISDLNKP